jgi:hypothetical protein
MSVIRTSRWSQPLIRLMAMTALGTFTAVGCQNVEKAKPQPTSVKSKAEPIPLDVPEIMRGTIASQAVVLGYSSPSSSAYRPLVVKGYGLVVGLNGTGSRDIPPQIRQYMITEAARGGMGQERFGPDIAGMKPEALLNSPNTAVVIVEAILPQGAPEGTHFDVRVYAEPRSNTSSLEGGTLYTTLLRPGPLTHGGQQPFPLAEARGPVFVNPFAEPGAENRDSVLRTTGRVLNGGVVTKDMPLKLRLANPSHGMAETLQNAINTRYPREAGQREETAHGESDSLVGIKVPPSWADDTDEFVQVLRHTTIVQGNPEVAAMFVKRTLLANPIVANAAALRWQAIGPRAIPIIRDLYDYPEELPRLAALRAGAKLDDAVVIPYLISLTKTASTSENRLQAIRLLAELKINPQIDVALRELLNDDDVEVRLDAYEALAKRRDPYLHETVVDNKFLIDVVDSDKPLIYISQARTPRVVVFGPDLAIERPTTFTAWSSRLMIKAESNDPEVEVYYRPTDADQGYVNKVNANLDEFIAFLGHTTTVEKPAPGLGLSYGETVGAVHQIWRQKYIKADFRAEQDRILAAILRQEEEQEVTERPEFADQGQPNASDSPPAIVPTDSDIGRLDRNTPPVNSQPTTNPASPAQPRPD